MKAEEALGEHGEEDEPAGQHRLHDRQRRKRERTDVQTPGHDRHDPADQEPPGAKQTDGAAQQMADLDRRGDHRAALLEQKGEVRRHGRSKRENQSEDHGKAGPRVLPARPAIARAWMILPGLSGCGQIGWLPLTREVYPAMRPGLASPRVMTRRPSGSKPTARARWRCWLTTG